MLYPDALWTIPLAIGLLGGTLAAVADRLGRPAPCHRAKAAAFLASRAGK